MELKQYKKCGQCRCFRAGITGFCELGYLINGIKLMGVDVNAIPQEPCPKPLTVIAYTQALRNHAK